MTTAEALEKYGVRGEVCVLVTTQSEAGRTQGVYIIPTEMEDYNGLRKQVGVKARMDIISYADADHYL